mgnify:CR=1 FL=1
MLNLLKRKQKQGGFTLLELLMVVIIIAILASIALPQYIRASEKARASEAIQILGALRVSEQRYKSQHPSNDYTATLAELDTDAPVMNNWAVPVVASTAAAAGIPAVGQITTTRTGTGVFSGQIVGIQLGTGTICGDFAPMGTAACAQD